MIAALELIDVEAGYGRINVLDAVNLRVEPGTVFALLGPNGAGKSTLLRVAGGRMAPTRGCVHIGGAHVNNVRPERLARAGVCTVPEGRAIFPNLTVLENLRMMGGTRRVTRADVCAGAFARFPRLAERRRQQAGTLSGGEQQMLAMARALTTDPSLLLLDEISMGLAPRIVAELYDLVAQLAAEGITILLVEQFARTALAVADAAAVMTHGHIAHIGSPEAIGQLLSAAYLGTGEETS